MPLIKLTENHYIDLETASEVLFTPGLGGPALEICYKDPQKGRVEYLGEEAVEAWQNFKQSLKGDAGEGEVQGA